MRSVLVHPRHVPRDRALPSRLTLLAYYDLVQGTDPNKVYDISGNGRDGTLGTGSNTPTWSADGRTLTFGGDDFVTISVALGSEYTWVAVATPTSSNITRAVIGGADGATYLGLVPSQVAHSVRMSNGANVRPQLSPLVNSIAMLSAGTISSSKLEIAVYNSQRSWNHLRQTLAATVNSQTAVRIGAAGTTVANSHIGPIWAVSLFSGAATPDEMTQIYRYMQWDVYRKHEVLI